MRKKITAAFLAAVLLSLTACAGGQAQKTSSPSSGDDEKIKISSSDSGDEKMNQVKRLAVQLQKAVMRLPKKDLLMT